MPKYKLTNQAVSDIAGIWNYSANKWSESQADSYYAMLIDACDKIAAQPNWFGRKYDEIRKGLLGCKVRKHIIFYMIEPSGNIIVIRILHEKMDMKSKF